MRRRLRSQDDGFTAIEVVIASAILLVALAGMMGVLASFHRIASYESGRQRSLDDLRITASAFAKDARHAAGVESASDSELVLSTYVNGALKKVTYRVVTTGGETNLERVEDGSAQRIFVIRLTSASIFTFDPPDLSRPEDIRKIGIHMESRPKPNDPPVVLETEVLLRNV